MSNSAAEELERLRAKLASIQSELKVATDSLSAATAGMVAMTLENSNLKGTVADLQRSLEADEVEIDEDKHALATKVCISHAYEG
jgi:predicted  nucleic acid-binding Zn-ribbon protein